MRLNNINKTRQTIQIEPVLDRSKDQRVNTEMVNTRQSFYKKPSAIKQYGNVAKLTAQQELFAQRMAQMRKEAKLKN